MTTYTKLPWKISRDGFKILARVDSTDDVIIASAGISSNAAHILKCVNGWDEQQARIDELASLLDKALEDVSKVDRWGEPHQPTIDFVNRCNELIALTRAKGAIEYRHPAVNGRGLYDTKE